MYIITKSTNKGAGIEMKFKENQSFIKEMGTMNINEHDNIIKKGNMKT